MSQTKIRSFRPDSNSVYDEEEQKMHLKKYRKTKTQTEDEEFDADDLDQDLAAEVKFLLSKVK